MDWTSLIGPAVVAAVISSLVSGFGIWISARTARRIHAEKLTFDQEQAERRAAAEIALAERKAAAERDLATRRRQTELAEQTLADFYGAQQAIAQARNHGVFANEGATRVRAEGESDSQTHYLDTLYVPLERLNRTEELFSRLFASRFRFQANFGTKSISPFERIREVRNEIVGAYLGLRQETLRGSSGKFHEDWTGVIWADYTEGDPLAKKVAAAVTDMEAFCRPILGHTGERP